MSEKVLVLSADCWEMPDERSGVINRGVSLWYINDYREDTETAVGSKPIKVSCSSEAFAQIRQAGSPGVFEIDFKTRPGAQGKPTLTVVHATSLYPLPLDALFDGRLRLSTPVQKDLDKKAGAQAS